MMEQITEHMSEHHLWIQDHYAYRTGLSTVTTLLTLQEEWLEMMEQKLQSLLISLDMSSMFDKVRHEVHPSVADCGNK